MELVYAKDGLDTTGTHRNICFKCKTIHYPVTFILKTVDFFYNFAHRVKILIRMHNKDTYIVGEHKHNQINFIPMNINPKYHYSTLVSSSKFDILFI